MLSPLLSLLVLLAGGGSSQHRLLHGVGAQQPCELQYNDCAASEVCTECTLSFEAATTPCTEYIFDSTNACDLHGVSYCCAAEAAGSLSCLTDGTTLEYWECTLEALGCALNDMPCFNTNSATSSGGSAVGEAETRSTSDDDTDVLTSAASRRPSAVGAAAATAAAAVAIAVSFATKGDGGSLLGL